jgi:hypothetical protein
VARSSRSLGLRDSPYAVFASLWENRRLVWQLTRREVVGRYRGSILGLSWSFFHPLLMLGVYTLVFGYIFRARWGSEVDSTADFAIVLFAGLIVFNIFAEARSSILPLRCPRRSVTCWRSTRSPPSSSRPVSSCCRARRRAGRR